MKKSFYILRKRGRENMRVKKGAKREGGRERGEDEGEKREEG